MFFVDGQAVRFVGTLLDVTREREDAEAARGRAEFDQQLLGIVSHDLRNPISAMMMGATLLKQRAAGDAVLERTVARILSSGDRATRLIRDLLDFTQARMGSGLPIDRRPSDVHGVCKQVVDELSLNHPSRTIVHVPSGDGRGQWDPDRLAQVVSNLTRNAVTYSVDGTPITVRSDGQSMAGHVALEVHNVGAPIPPEVIPTLFQPFRRGEGRHDPDRSIGLGLFIVSQIVNAHGGKVTARSTVHEGTTFRVELPRAA